MGKNEKSKPITNLGDVIPSDHPVHLPSSIHRKELVKQHSKPGLDHGIQHHPKGLNNGFRSPEPINTFHTAADSTSAVPFHVEQNEKYCGKLHKNRKQTGSICGGLLLLLVSGLHIGWGVWRTDSWFIRSTNMSLHIFSIMVWPLGAIFGGFIGSAVVTVLRKNFIYLIAAAVMVVGNVLFIIWDKHYAAIVMGRLLTSLAHGTVFIAVVTQAGENAAKNMRGTILSTMNCLLFAAIFISVHVTSIVDAGFSVERILGIIALIFVVASIVCTLTVNIETVPFLLTKREPNFALENMKLLRDVAIESPQMTREMEEFKLMVTQDGPASIRNVFSKANAKPLVLMTMIRLMAAVTNNFLLNIVLIGFCQLILSNYQYAPMLFVAPRLATSVIQIFYADVFGRKIQMIVSAALTGLILIALGTAYSFNVNYYIPSMFCIWFQLFCGMGIQQMSDVYLAEAFSTATKPWSLSFVMAIEHLFQLFMTGMAFTTVTSTGLYALLFGSGISVIVIGVALMFTLPETKRTTLKQATDLFRNETFNLKL